jgi:hypothetical protein
LEIAERLTFEEHHDCWTVAKVLRGYVTNDISEEVQAWKESVDERLSFLDKAAWKAVMPVQISINDTMRLWMQMTETLSEVLRSPNSTPRSLDVLQTVCEEVHPDGNPVMEKLVNVNRMFVYVCLGRIHEASEAAKSLVKTFETYPMLLNLTRQPSDTHILLDSALLLGDARLSKRIAVIRQSLSTIPRSEGQISLIQTFYRYILDKLLMQLPISVLTAQNWDAKEVDAQMNELEEQLEAEKALLVRDAHSLLAPVEETRAR